MKNFLAKNKGNFKAMLPTVIYLTIYLIWWGYLERNITTDYTVIHMGIDDYIPFCEFFVVPYMLWFPYMIAFGIYYFSQKEKGDYYRLITFLFTGMTIFLMISTFFPNGHHLRMIGSFPRYNVFSKAVSMLWRTDTPTNLWPSIHVYNSLGVYFSIANSERLKSNWLVRIPALILTGLIIASTLLIKQHSMFDVITGFIMAAVIYALVYMYDIVFVVRTANSERRNRAKA
ncbi:MAG: phosphatase PAP2 family protein [Lachnospiraceae bacterium]|nr:phosphatase PAP2 family protein [Lachnospiraceae bacterium]